MIYRRALGRYKYKNKLSVQKLAEIGPKTLVLQMRVTDKTENSLVYSSVLLTR